MIDQRLLEESWPTRWWDEIDSTSVEASRHARTGDRGPLWIAARKQNSGKGRLGRPWVSQPGNLYTTAILPILKPSSEIASVSLTVALGVRDCVIEVTQGVVLPDLKWPNDLRVNTAKISGILLEVGQINSQESWLTIGIGLNIRHAPEIPNYRTASLSQLKADLFVTPEQALSVLDVCLRKRLRQHLTSGLSSIIKDWEAASDQIGALCRATQNGQIVSGYFRGLDQSGQMRLELQSGEMIIITAGDVELVRKEDPHADGN